MVRTAIFAETHVDTYGLQDAAHMTACVSPAQPRIEITLNDAWEEYLDTGRLKGEQAKTAKSVMERHVLPVYGNVPIKSISRDTLTALHESVFTQARGQACTLLKTMKPFLNYACRTGLIDENPISGFKLALPNTTRNTYKIQELGRVVHIAGLIEGRWKQMLALSLATTAPLEEIRNMRCEEIDWQRMEWTITEPSSTTVLLLGGRTVPLSSYAQWLLKEQQGKQGYVFRSSRTRHNGQSTAEPTELPFTWRSSITEAIRQHAGIPGAWTMKDMRRSAAILSGFRRAIVDLADAEPNFRQARLAATMEVWGRRLSSAVDDCRPALSMLDPVIRIED